MIAMIIVSAMFLLVILVAIEVAVPLIGFFLGGIVFPIFVWLLAFGMMTITGLQKNKKGFFECRDWWKKWNKYVNDPTTTIPKNSCQFYWHTVGLMAASIITSIIISLSLESNATLLARSANDVKLDLYETL